MRLRNLFLTLALLPLVLIAQERPDAFNRNGMNIKGNVTSFTETIQEANRRGESTGKPYEHTLYSFNEKGQLVEEVDKPNDVYSKTATTYQYDESGRLAREQVGTSSRYLDVYTYRKSGNTVTRISNGDAADKDVYVFDNQGRLVEWFVHTVSETNYWKRFQMTYNSSGQLTECRRDGGPGSFDTKISYVYDSRGNIIKETFYDFKDKEIDRVSTYEYTYDGQGNWLTRLHGMDLGGDSDKSYYLAKRVYTYGSGSLSGAQASIASEFGAGLISSSRASYTSSSSSSSSSSGSSSSLSAWDCYMLGQDYIYGRNGQSSDYAQAMKWYRSAADKGLALAMRDIAYLYKAGKGVSVDYAEAVRWYRMAADRGDASSMNSLGYRYDQGTGVTRDYAEAMRWYQKAAALGNAAAMYNIGMLYKNGQGVSSSLTEAKKWFQLSADGGDEDAKEQLKKL